MRWNGWKMYRQWPMLRSKPACATVTGGALNTASGPGASISGGLGNQASGFYSSVGGGRNNMASGELSSISGGQSVTLSNLGDWAAGAYHTP